jgi:hypothetical protein
LARLQRPGGVDLQYCSATCGFLAKRSRSYLQGRDTRKGWPVALPWSRRDYDPCTPVCRAGTGILAQRPERGSGRGTRTPCPDPEKHGQNLAPPRPRPSGCHRLWLHLHPSTACVGEQRKARALSLSAPTHARTGPPGRPATAQPRSLSPLEPDPKGLMILLLLLQCYSTILPRRHQSSVT